MTNLERLLVGCLHNHLSGKRGTVPEAGRLLWKWFADLSATRTYHAAGPHPISYAEIEAYARLMRWPLEPRHVELIRALDRVWLEYAHPARSIPAASYPRNAPEITEEAFDAVFG